MCCADLSIMDFGNEEVLTLSRASGHTPQHGKLAHVRQRIGYRPLHKPVNRSLHRRARRKKLVESREKRVEALDISGPAGRWVGIPFAAALSHREPPFHQIAHVGQYLDWLTPSALERGKTVRSIFKGAGRTISEGSHQVAE